MRSSSVLLFLCIATCVGAPPPVKPPSAQANPAPAANADQAPPQPKVVVQAPAGQGTANQGPPQQQQQPQQPQQPQQQQPQQQQQQQQPQNPGPIDSMTRLVEHPACKADVERLCKFPIEEEDENGKLSKQERQIQHNFEVLECFMSYTGDEKPPSAACQTVSQLKSTFITFIY